LQIKITKPFCALDVIGLLVAALLSVNQFKVPVVFKKLTSRTAFSAFTIFHRRTGI